ncbi:hypothetical protein SAMN05518849_1011117 [Sphingobium sp. AP50]|uniref:hypothetical protein n=1 Tax=Sphingobium sp. AP50 TaxID=1884369 RepID=UPI0008B355EE|nr:hypothetical protein [Sphingobium sp. AP50]SEI85375.1 hypothetical protein SAMN05518849_1011117 [Sphingobium sp. AP50]
MSVASLQLRRFVDPVPNIAEDWFDNPIQILNVTRIGDYSSSADGACRVTFGGSRVGFVKPRMDAGTPVVANEKIAADLGFLLHLPVAPVVIRAPQDGTEWDRFTILSLACLGSGRHWGEGNASLNQHNVPGLEALRTFWTWIGDIDHNQHPQNLLYEIDSSGRMQLLSIDHSYLLGQGADASTLAASEGYGTCDQPNARPAREVAVAAIEALDEQDVQHIVRRLVGTVLTDVQAEDTIGWLAARRNQLRSLMKLGGDND